MTKKPAIVAVDDKPEILDTYVSLFNYGQEPAGYVSQLRALVDMPVDNASPLCFDCDLFLVGGGEKALEVFEERGGDVAVVILDIRMPPFMTGLAAGKLIRAQYPDTEIIFVSGFSDFTLEEMQAAVGPRMVFLRKPVEPDTLLSVVSCSVANYLRNSAHKGESI